MALYMSPKDDFNISVTQEKNRKRLYEILVKWRVSDAFFYQSSLKGEVLIDMLYSVDLPCKN